MNASYDIVDDAWLSKAKSATRLFAEVAGASAELVTVDWQQRVDDKHRTLLQFKAKDPFSDEVMADFTPDELDREDHLRGRFYRVWGDILQSQSTRMLNDLHRALAVQE